MAEEDDSQKTEDPTSKKLEDARKKGQVPVSKEVGNFMLLFGGGLVTVMMGPTMAESVRDLAVGFIEHPHMYDVSDAGLPLLFKDIIIGMLWVLGIPFVLLVFFAAAGHLVQNGIVVAVERIEPKPDKLNPLNGLKNQFSLKTLVEFAKNVSKIVLVGVVLALVIMPEMLDIELYPQMSLGLTLERLYDMIVILLIATISLTAVIAGLDFAYQRYEFNKQMKMSKQEIKDEYKQTEGSPEIKAKVRQIRMERAQQRMMSSVPKADVVITNPTHFAVALQYDIDTMGAPMCIAKGQDNVALKIREVAEEHDITIMENPPVARALFATVEIDQEIPPEHYKAVAEIISFVFRQRGKKLG
ncbi:flagellar biosynthesis protein FlhB [Thalassospira profundimaris]|uniref:flagellar biosynthesis protein FlhB n=1 Tax=unclassified Thalassospira TaxID=2648997 RepID=UPI000DED5590|nr:flagellar biosynthesis protein FlhB [Thalassospira sp.]MBO6771797.1 flagellar biosynthesis protein FlhB [Thalassospira sp.]RCK24460.1 flagellar biosynthesis protein FlhB [Thalassospira profundimaris]